MIPVIVPVFVMPPEPARRRGPGAAGPAGAGALSVPESTIAPVKTPMSTIALFAVPTAMPIALSPDAGCIGRMLPALNTLPMIVPGARPAVLLDRIREADDDAFRQSRNAPGRRAGDARRDQSIVDDMPMRVPPVALIGRRCAPAARESHRGLGNGGGGGGGENGDDRAVIDNVAPEDAPGAPRRR